MVQLLVAAGCNKDQAKINVYCCGRGTRGEGKRWSSYLWQLGTTRIKPKLLASHHCLLLLRNFPGHEGVVLELIVAGCDKDKANNLGSTELIAAAYRGRAEVVQELLAACATRI